MKPERLVFHLALRPLAGNWRTGRIQMLRALLKAAKRAYGFRCVSVTDVPEPTPYAQGEGEHYTEAEKRKRQELISRKKEIKQSLAGWHET